MSKYPEHQKLKAVSDQTQAAGDFLYWLMRERNMELRDSDGAPIFVNVEDLLADWKDIDRMALEQEKQAMLDELRGE